MSKKANSPEPPDLVVFSGERGKLVAIDQVLRFLTDGMAPLSHAEQEIVGERIDVDTSFEPAKRTLLRLLANGDLRAVGEVQLDTDRDGQELSLSGPPPGDPLWESFASTLRDQDPSVDHGGYYVYVPASLWRQKYLHWPNLELRGQTGGLTSILTNLSLPQEEVRRLPSLAKQVTVSAKNKGGRPPKYEWEEFWLELCFFTYSEGFPERQEALVKTMQQWCASTWGEEPADSEIKKRISRLYHRLSIS